MVITDHGDNEVLRSIHKRSFTIPENYLIKRYVVDNGKLVGGGIVRLIAEGILIIDELQSIPTKVRAIEGLVNDMSPYLKRFGIDDCHVFVKDDKMIKFLEKLGFKPCVGTPMIIHLKNLKENI